MVGYCVARLNGVFSNYLIVADGWHDVFPFVNSIVYVNKPEALLVTIPLKNENSGLNLRVAVVLLFPLAFA